MGRTLFVPGRETSFPSLAAFYGADRRRERSLEMDFGYGWTSPLFAWPRHRISWIEATGELYSVELGGPGTVVVYATIRSRIEVMALMAGWEDHCGPGGLDWFQERAARA